jgi:NAD(P)-dependent dehydrogenase (short-subunit alcohol dehydrogenase family)
VCPESPRRAAIVTGDARGIGAAAALALHAAGFQVATFDVLPASVADSDDRMHVVADVSDADTVSASVGAVVRRFGRLDVLVNNAGILDVHAVDDTPRTCGTAYWR